MAENKKTSKKKVDQTTEEYIEEVASLQFTDFEIAMISEIPIKELLAKYSVNIDRGRLLAEAEVRRSILQMAKQGSTPAQKQFVELNKRAKKTRR